MSDVTTPEGLATIAEAWRRDRIIVAGSTNVDRLELPGGRVLQGIPDGPTSQPRPDPGITRRRQERKRRRQDRKRGRGARRS